LPESLAVMRVLLGSAASLPDCATVL